MIISWDWLSQYVPLTMSREELELRLMMAGLNHEGTEIVDGDAAIELEVTSNRADCLGHLGVAREIAVLFDEPLSIPEPKPPATGLSVDSLAQVSIENTELCSRYTARVIRGVKIGPSPEWLVKRLATIGQKSVNNVVDITNYVLMECGQPLHAFDFAKLAGGQIIVRRAKQGEQFEAIDHNSYELDERMCVIADASRPVAIAGVMGGADSEVSATTTDLLIESAAFDPLAVRSAARTLNLMSPSSFRFERSPDPAMVDWASRRCCEFVLDLAGGTLCEGLIDAGRHAPPREPITLRHAAISRLLGIDVPPGDVRRILAALGTIEQTVDKTQIEVVPPSWRADLTREVDLIEEVARIHGYDQIPEDVDVPMAASQKREIDRVTERLRHGLTSLGFDEAMTASVVTEDWSDACSPWSAAAPLTTSTPLLRGAHQLRRSLIPSLLGARRYNETLSNPVIELFEMAHVYLSRQEELPEEQMMLAMSSGGGYYELKGVLETLLHELNPAAELEVLPCDEPLFAPGRCGELRLAGERLGFLGEVSEQAAATFGLGHAGSVAELLLNRLVESVELTPTFAPLSPFPTVERDVNLVVSETVHWSELLATMSAAAGPMLESLDCTEVFRDEQRLGAGRKSLVAKLILRSDEATLTGEQADTIRDAAVAACVKAHDAEQR